MSTQRFEISGGDFDRAGLASGQLKARLKQIGIEADVVRRAMIAAYEAEMNVVLHAHKGRMVACLQDGWLDVRVQDHGPGIADIEQAMQEGFSTASAEARALGFGAGMGLPNIQRHSDRFAIHSVVGQGTQVEFSIAFAPQAAPGLARHSIRIVNELCRECLRCLWACPTAALRVRQARPEILEHLCIDCPACIDACPTGALTTPLTPHLPERSEDRALILPGAFVAQFSPRIGPRHVMAALAELGFRDARVLDSWERALREAVIRYAADEATSRPVISPTCPAVVNLIEMRFPSLIGNLAPFLSPVEAAQRASSARPAAFVAVCPSQCTALTSGGASARTDVIAPSVLRQAVLKLAASRRRPRAARAGGGESPPPRPETREVSGGRHVLNVLDRLENGQLDLGGVLELFVCDQGCFGSPLLSQDAFVARWRWAEAELAPDPLARAIRRQRPYVARPGVRLDADMSQAIAKLAELDALTKRLPGADCGRCGAPTCAALAEDIVLGRASVTACVRRHDGKERPT